MNTLRYYADTEFSEDDRDGVIRLISIGLVCEDGRELHLCNRFIHLDSLSPWHKQNVVPHLPPYSEKDKWLSPPEIRDKVAAFFRDGAIKPELWMYYGAYDWVLICKLFGRMIDLPKDLFPRYYKEIKQLADSLGGVELPAKPKDAHSALADAQWNRHAHSMLRRQASVLRERV